MTDLERVTKLAQQAEALTIAQAVMADNKCGLKVVDDALNATQADVDAFMDKKKAEWEKEFNQKERE